MNVVYSEVCGHCGAVRGQPHRLVEERKFGPCPKCQNIDIGLLYRSGVFDVICQQQSHPTVEHFDLTCRTCHYAWFEGIYKPGRDNTEEPPTVGTTGATGLAWTEWGCATDGLPWPCPTWRDKEADWNKHAAIANVVRDVPSIPTEAVERALAFVYNLAGNSSPGYAVARICAMLDPTAALLTRVVAAARARAESDSDRASQEHT